MVINYVKPDKTADFEMVMGKVKEALAKSEKPERKAQAEGWKIFKTDLPGPGGAITYFAIVDPVIKGNDYNMRTILTEAFGVADTNTIYKTLADSVAGQQLVAMTHQCLDEIGGLRTSDSVLRRCGALASSAHRFPA